MAQANGLFDFYQFSSVNPRGGFYELYDDGRPISDVRQLHATTRMVHCMAIGHLLGRPGCDALVDHGMNSSGTATATRNMAAISGRWMMRRRMTIPSRPMAMPLCCSRHRVRNVWDIRWPTRCWPM